MKTERSKLDSATKSHLRRFATKEMTKAGLENICS